MKATPERIKERAEQLKSNGFKIRANMVKATLELNAGARRQLPGNGETEPATNAEVTNAEVTPSDKASNPAA
ncbi:MAG TPA: hypothetical protein VFB79_12480 [Candidatus Angelobacter sp.]|nr:hypothetical protein [Candidatus Angelobacter sp.]